MYSIVLLRHGRVEGGEYYRGVTDDPLSHQGMAQMHDAIAHQTFTQVVTSPLQRCLHFAEMLNVPYRVDKNLSEINFGLWERQTYDQLRQQDPQGIEKFWRDPTQFTPPRGEGVAVLQQRVLAAWQDIVQDCQPQQLIITHGGPIRIIVAQLLSIPLSQLQSIEVPHASVTRIVRDGEHVQLVTHNTPC